MLALGMMPVAFRAPDVEASLGGLKPVCAEDTQYCGSTGNCMSPIADSGCAVTSDCLVNQVCDLGNCAIPGTACVSECDSSSYCEANNRTGNVGVCVEPHPTEVCTEDSNCTAPAFCNELFGLCSTATANSCVPQEGRPYCEGNEFCEPAAGALQNTCVKPENPRKSASCSATPCAATGYVCEPLTETCVYPNEHCLPTACLDAGAYCSSKFEHCVKPSAKGTICSGSHCGPGEECDPHFKVCVSLMEPCAPPVNTTAIPTAAPTSAPVVAPTSAPVVAPTSAPVVAPTSAPVVAPSSAPVTPVPSA